VSKITEAANRIADTVKKIQTLRHDEPKTYAGGKTILNWTSRFPSSLIEDKDDDFAKSEKTLRDHSSA
jgi:two-component system cell cycle response regulator